MNVIKSYKWYLENGCEIVPLKKLSNKGNEYSLTLLDIQADFSDLFDKVKSKKSEEIKEDITRSNIFYKQNNPNIEKKKNDTEREEYVTEIDNLWAYIEWKYNFHDEIKIQKELIVDTNNLKKNPVLYVSTHIIEGIINEMDTNSNICILKYTTFSNISPKHKDELNYKENNMFELCNYVYEICDIADKSLIFSNSPVINTTVRNVLSITKSGKKREDFNEEKEDIIEDEIWQIYISKQLQAVNDQWLLICINDDIKKLINKNEIIYFKMFNKFIKEYNNFVKCHNFHKSDNKNEKFNSLFNNPNSTLNYENEKKNKNISGYEKYKINLIFSENKDINFIIYRLCLNLGNFNDVVLCTKNKTYNILMNDIDGTMAICFKSFSSKYYKNNTLEKNISECSQYNGILNKNDKKNSLINIKEEEEDGLIKTISIMGLCKEKMLLFEKSTIFNNIDLIYSYYLLVNNEALISTNKDSNEKGDDDDDDGIIYLSKNTFFKNVQFSNEEISSYLLHLQKYSTNNLIYVKNKGFRYLKNEISYEFLIKLLELLSLNEELYDYQHTEKGKFKNNIFTKYNDDLRKIKIKRYGITFTNLFKLINDNIKNFQLFETNKLPIEKYILLQLCLKFCDIENKHFEYFTIYYNYYFFYEYLNKESTDFCFESIFNEYLNFLHNDDYIDETIIYFNLFRLHRILSLNVLRTSGRVLIYSEKLFTFDMNILTYVKYIDTIFKNFNSNLIDKIIQYFLTMYQFFMDYGYDKSKSENKKSSNIADNNINENANMNETDFEVGIEKYRNRVFFRNNVILNVNNINHICNDEYMFQYFVVVKYYYSDNSFGLLETKLKKFIKKAEEDFIENHHKSVEFDINKKMKINWQKLKSFYCLNYKIFKYQTIPFPNIRINYNYNDLLNMVYSPLSLHFSIFNENVIYNKKEGVLKLIPSFLFKDNLRSCLTTLFTLKNSYYAQELYPFLNPLLNNKDMIGTIAVPPLRHCRTKLIEKENDQNVEFLKTDNILCSTLNNDIKGYNSSDVSDKKYIENLCKLYNCNLPVNIFNK